MQLYLMIQFLPIYCDVATLCKWLCCYVQKTKNKLPYQASTLCSLLAALQQMMHANKYIFDKADMLFRHLHMTLDTVCVSLRNALTQELNNFNRHSCGFFPFFDSC